MSHLSISFCWHSLSLFCIIFLGYGTTFLNPSSWELNFFPREISFFIVGQLNICLYIWICMPTCQSFCLSRLLSKPFLVGCLKYVLHLSLVFHILNFLPSVAFSKIYLCFWSVFLLSAYWTARRVKKKEGLLEIWWQLMSYSYLIKFNNKAWLEIQGFSCIMVSENWASFKLVCTI